MNDVYGGLLSRDMARIFRKIPLVVVLVVNFWFDLSGCAAPGFLWAKQAGGTNGNSSGQAVAYDSSGNCFVTGLFSGAFGNPSASSSGLFDVFLAKYDSLGNLVWVSTGGGDGYDYGYGMAVDVDGNVLVTGSFEGTSANFGDTVHTWTFNAGTGSKNIFVLKYDNMGNCLWAQRAGKTSNQSEGFSIAVDTNGNCFLTGAFGGVAQFGMQTLTSYGGYDIFVAKYDSAGNALWARHAGASGSGASFAGDKGYGIASDSQGNIFVTGYVSGGATIFDTITLPGGDEADFFLAKYSGDGAIQWVRKAGRAQGTAVATSRTGDCFVTGIFSGFTRFATRELTSAGSQDVFLAKYDTLAEVYKLRP